MLPLKALACSKAVPVVDRSYPLSLAASLRKGGKAVPDFQPPSRSLDNHQMLQPQSVSLPIVPSAVSSGSPVQVPSGPVQSHPAPRGPKRSLSSLASVEISSDLQHRWMFLVNSIGAISQIWVDYHASPLFETHCVRIISSFAVLKAFNTKGATKATVVPCNCQH